MIAAAAGRDVSAGAVLDLQPDRIELHRHMQGLADAAAQSRGAEQPGSVSVGHRLTIEKSFAFEKSKRGSWRCSTETLRPVEFGTAKQGP